MLWLVLLGTVDSESNDRDRQRQRRRAEGIKLAFDCTCIFSPHIAQAPLAQEHPANLHCVWMVPKQAHDSNLLDNACR